MSEENTNTEELEGAVAAAETDDYEAEARSMGWRPQEEYDGPEDSWVSAEEYVARAPLYKGLSKQSRKIKRLEKAIQDLAAHNKAIADTNREARIRELEEAKEAALEEGNVKDVTKYDREIRAEEAKGQKQPDTNPAFEDWLDDNPWYEEDTDLAAIADKRGLLLYQQNPNRPIDDIYQEVSKYIKEKYMEQPKRQTSREAPPDGGEPPKRRAGGKGQNLKAKLSAEQRKAMNEFVELGLMSEDEYIKQLQDANML